MLHEQSYSTFKSKRADLINSSTMLQTPGVVLISVGFFAGVAELVFFGGTGLILLIAGGIKANLRPSNEREFVTPARRPKYSALSNAYIESLGLQPMPPLEQAVRSYLSLRARLLAA